MSAATRRLPDLSQVVIAGAKVKSDVADAVTRLGVDFRTGQVAELSIDLADPGRLARRALTTVGTEVRWNGTRWQVGAVDRDWAAWGVATTVHCRSQVAKRLRKRVKASAESNRTPAAWIGPRVRDAGGRAVVQSAPSWPVISQGNDQTDLDVIVAICSESRMDWTEHDGVFYVGTLWWAYGGGPGLPTWRATWMSGDDDDNGLLALATVDTDDDPTQAASGTAVLSNTRGIRVRPWHRLKVTGTGSDDDGLWLVTSVTVDLDGTSPATVELTRPVKSAPKAGSSPQDTGDTSVPSTVAGKAAIAVQYALSQLGKPYSYSANPPSSWDCSKLTAAAWGEAGVQLTAYTYTQVTECNPVDRAALEPGDLIFYFRDAHHVAMYIGGGQIVEATPSYGVRTTDAWNNWATAHYSSCGRPKGA